MNRKANSVSHSPRSRIHKKNKFVFPFLFLFLLSVRMFISWPPQFAYLCLDTAPLVCLWPLGDVARPPERKVVRPFFAIAFNF